MDQRDSLTKLTEREKVCLRQWLQHKSAKEIAVDLGVSHHAVEKRLKMARTKLGASSSLEAARLLGEAEGYGQAAPQSPDLSLDTRPPQSAGALLTILGVGIMVLVGAIVLGLVLQPAAFSQAADNQSAVAPLEQVLTPGAVPTAGTDAALRRLVAGLASGSPAYDKISPQFAQVVRRDLPMTHPLFQSMGELKSATFLGRGDMGDDVYDLVFAKGAAIMSATLDDEGRMAGGILRPLGPHGAPTSAPAAGSEAAVRGLVAGLVSGSPDYDGLTPQFAQAVRRDLPTTHPLFSSLGELKSVRFLGRGDMGDDAYSLVFAKGGMIMSTGLDGQGKMTGGMLQPVRPPAR